MTEEKLRSLAELQQAVLQGMVSDPLVPPAAFSLSCQCLNLLLCCAVLQAGCQGSCCSVVHIVSCEEEFQQQQMDLLWRILDPGASMDLQVRNSYTLHCGSCVSPSLAPVVNADAQPCAFMSLPFPLASNFLGILALKKEG